MRAETVLHEWREACRVGDAERADRIRAAHPDLFDDEGDPVWPAVPQPIRGHYGSEGVGR